MRRPLIALLATSISFAPGMAAGADSSDAVRDAFTGIGLPSGALMATGSGEDLHVEAPGRRLEDALRAAIDPTDVRTQMDAVRLLIEGDTGVRLPDLRPAHTRDTTSTFQVFPDRQETREEPVPEPAPEPEATGTMSFPSPAGDLSGDGLDDILSYDIKLPQEVVEIRALRGTDGTRLWKRRLDDVADALALPAGDLTGDGVDDLTLIGLEVVSESDSFDCPEDGDHCRVDYEAEYTWITGVLDGTDGRLRWSREYQASLDFHYLFETEADTATETDRVEESLTSTNLSVWPYLSGDHDRDGVDDLVLEAIDLHYDIAAESHSTARVLYEDEGAFEVDSATRAVVVRGKSGEDLLRRSSERGPTVAVLEPAGNLVGDSTPDLLWQDTTYTNDTYSCIGIVGLDHCPDARDTSMRLGMQAIDGATLDVAWRQEASDVDDAFAFPLQADLSGDGLDDVAQLTLVEDGPVFATRMVSGANGNLLWERTQRPDAFWWEFPIATGGLGGGPGTDVVLASFIETSEPLTGPTDHGIRITRVDGASGETLFESDRSVWVEPQDPPEDTVALSLYRYIGWPQDADGDGIADVYAGGIGEVLVDDGSEWLVPAETDSRAFVESSLGNSVLLQRDTQDAMVFDAVPDLDGDARADVFEWHYPADPFGDDPHFELIARRATPGEPLWSRAFVGDEFWLGTLWTGGDHDGLSGEELLYGDNSNRTGGWRSLVGSLRGADGSVRWLKGGDD